MFLEQAVIHSLDLGQPLTVLDLCAAPGGKSTHLLSLLSPDSLLVCNEAIRSRASVLSENIQKWGHANALVCSNDPSRFPHLQGLFDLVVVDAPCSGEGLFRKDNEALREWSPAHVELCALRQRRILKEVWPALKENGILVFCTCTYNALEDEGTMEWLGQAGDCEFMSIPLKKEWGIVETKSKNTVGYRFYPHKVKGEGFFLSVVRKKGRQDKVRFHNKEALGERCKREEIKSWLTGPMPFRYVVNKGLAIAVPEAIHEVANGLAEMLNIVHFGIPMATDKRGKLVPQQSAAMSVHLNKENFACYELSRAQAIGYLRKEPLEINHSEKGFALFTYDGNPLGWANLLPHRINNLYPSNWRIRMMPR